MPLAGNNQVPHHGIADSPPKTAIRSVRRCYQFQQFQRLVNLEPELGSYPARLVTVSQAFPAAASLTHSPETRLQPRKLLPFTPPTEGPAVQGAEAMLASERPGAVQAIEAGAQDEPVGTPWSFKGSDGDSGPIVESDDRGPEEPELYDDPFYDSSPNFRDYATSPGRRSWRAIQRLFSSRRFSQAMATAGPVALRQHTRRTLAWLVQLRDAGGPGKSRNRNEYSHTSHQGARCFLRRRGLPKGNQSLGEPLGNHR